MALSDITIRNAKPRNREYKLAGGVPRYAVATARLVSDPTRYLRGALTAPKVKHHAAILEPQKAGELLRAIDSYSGNIAKRLALALAKAVHLKPFPTLEQVQHGERVCPTVEAFKAWSQNLGHEKVMTTLTSYGAVAPQRQAELIRGMGASRPANRVDPAMAAEFMTVVR